MRQNKSDIRHTNHFNFFQNTCIEQSSYNKLRYSINPAQLFKTTSNLASFFYLKVFCILFWTCLNCPKPKCKDCDEDKCTIRTDLSLLKLWPIKRQHSQYRSGPLRIKRPLYSKKSTLYPSNKRANMKH